LEKKESGDDEEKKMPSDPMRKLDWWCRSEFEKKRKNENTQTKIKNENRTKETETSKGRDERQTRLMSAWTLLHDLLRGLPDRLSRESKGWSFTEPSWWPFRCPKLSLCLPSHACRWFHVACVTGWFTDYLDLAAKWGLRDQKWYCLNGLLDGDNWQGIWGGSIGLELIQKLRLVHDDDNGQDSE
jgi:hypothetical protein